MAALIAAGTALEVRAETLHEPLSDGELPFYSSGQSLFESIHSESNAVSGSPLVPPFESAGQSLVLTSATEPFKTAHDRTSKLMSAAFEDSGSLPLPAPITDWEEQSPNRIQYDPEPDAVPLAQTMLLPEPGDLFVDDVTSLVPELWLDTKALVTRENGFLLGTTLAAALALRGDIDGDVRSFVRQHPRRWGKASRVLGYIGDAQYQAPLLAGLYIWSLHREDPEMHDVTSTLIRTWFLTGMATTITKGIANTERPSDTWLDGKFGFPSNHTASAFAFAAVLDERYGPGVGVPLYLLSGLIGWSRIDEQDHDMSDVVFGAVMGYVIGKTIARRQWGRNSRWQVVPYVHPTGQAQGIGLAMFF